MANSPTAAPADQKYHPVTDRIENNLQEGMIERIPELSLGTEDAELARNINEAIASGKTLHDELKDIRDLNEAYYLGRQTKEGLTEKTTGVENRDFFSIETLVPICTSHPVEPICLVNEEEKEQGTNLEHVLLGIYQEDETALSLQTALRHYFLYRVGILKIVLDLETKEFETVFVRPQRVIVGPIGVKEKDIPYFAELVDGTFGELLDLFPDKEKEITSYFAVKLNGQMLGRTSPVMWWEFWTNEFVAWKLGDVILDKAKNPFYDFDNLDNNFVKKPFKPYFLLNRILSLGKNAIDDTSFIEQNKPIEDGINKVNRAVTADLADRGTVIGSGDGIGKDALGEYRGAENETVWIEKGNPNAVIARLQPKPVNPTALEFKQEMQKSSDDIYGVHNTTRGDRGVSETATGRAILKDQDLGRTKPITDAIDAMMRKLYRAQVQVIKLFWNKEHLVPYLDEAGVGALIPFMANNLPKKAHLTVKGGSSLPKDKILLRNEAMELAKMNKIADETLYERLGWSRPKEAAEKLYIQTKVNAGAMPPDILFPGIAQKIKEVMMQIAGEVNGNVNQNPPVTEPNNAAPNENAVATPDLMAAMRANLQ